MKKIVIHEKPLNRQYLADPHSEMVHRQRLVKSKAIDLKDNHCIEVLKNGYWIIKPVNIEKTYK